MRVWAFVSWLFWLKSRDFEETTPLAATSLGSLAQLSPSQTQPPATSSPAENDAAKRRVDSLADAARISRFVIHSLWSVVPIERKVQLIVTHFWRGKPYTQLPCSRLQDLVVAGKKGGNPWLTRINRSQVLATVDRVHKGDTFESTTKTTTVIRHSPGLTQLNNIWLFAFSKLDLNLLNKMLPPQP